MRPLEAYVWLWAAVAVAAEGGADVHGFALAPLEPDARDPLWVVRPDAATPGEISGGALFEFATAPLVRHEDPEFGGPLTEVVVGNAALLDLSVSGAPHERVRLDAGLPVVLVTTDALGDAQSPTLGDLRLRATGLLTQSGDRRPGLGLVAWLDAPTGDADRWLGRGGLGGGSAVAATWSDEWVVIAGDVGAQFDPEAREPGFPGGDALVVGLAAGVLPEARVGLMAEARMSAPFRAAAVPMAATPIEALLSARFRTSPGVAVAGVGAGLTRGAGASPIRVFVGGGLGRVQDDQVRDTDPLGELRVADRCPAALETLNGWMDDDGCPDLMGRIRVAARWRDVPVPASVTARWNGEEHLLAVPEQGVEFEVPPGQTVRLEAAAGCLAGLLETVALEGSREARIDLALQGDSRVRVEVVSASGDAIPGAMVRWASYSGCVPSGDMAVAPDGTLVVDVGAGAHKVLADAPGHGVGLADVVALPGREVVVRIPLEPARVALERGRLRLDEKVFFETGRSVIRPISFDLLDEVAAVLLSHPEAGAVEVAGHTDAQGDDARNQQLSLERAESVVAYLVRRGVPAGRLTARGYGETRPVGDNATSTGRDANRRVEFTLGAPP
jgi:outer membrane protein OmpA-like peptidoglycan-associated protein